MNWQLSPAFFRKERVFLSYAQVKYLVASVLVLKITCMTFRLFSE